MIENPPKLSVPYAFMAVGTFVVVRRGETILSQRGF